MSALSKKVHPALVKIVTPNGGGSGFLVREDGLVLTAQHVIASASEAQIKLENGKTYRVLGVVKHNRRKDYAFLKVEGEAFSTLPIGSVGTAWKNSKVTTFGYPGGGSLKTVPGAVVASQSSPVLGRQFFVSGGTGHGGSGGPIVNERGEVIALVHAMRMGISDRFVAIDVQETLPLPDASAEVTPLSIVSEGYAQSAAADYEAAKNILLSLKPGERDPQKIAAAEQRLQDAIGKEKDCVEAYAVLGHMYLVTERFEEAREACEQAVRLSPEDVLMLYALGQVYSQLKQTREAAATFKKIQKLDPTMPGPYYCLGLVETQAGRHKQAIPLFREAIRLKPTYSHAYWVLGECYTKLGSYQEGLAAIRRAVQLNPNQYLMYLSLANLYVKLERTSEALTALQKAARLKPDDPSILHLMALSYLELEQDGQAIACYQKLKRLAPERAEQLYPFLPKGTPR